MAVTEGIIHHPKQEKTHWIFAVCVWQTRGSAGVGVGVRLANLVGRLPSGRDEVGLTSIYWAPVVYMYMYTGLTVAPTSDIHVYRYELYQLGASVKNV